jgi:hypothetical protein
MPIHPNDIYPDYGRINEEGEFSIDKYNDTYETQKIDSLYDVYCVAIGKKPLAGTDLTTKHAMKHLQDCIEEGISDGDNILKVQEYLNEIRIPYIQWTGKSNYLRNIYYNKNDKKGFENAIKLILILHTEYYDLNELEYHIGIGLLLGYKPERIKGFLIRNLNYREYVVSKDELLLYIKNVGQLIQKLDFDKEYIMKVYPIEIKYGVNTKYTNN